MNPTSSTPTTMNAADPRHHRGPRVDIHSLSRHFGTGPAEISALEDIELAITAGDTVALMGPSGSGKSTLLHLVGAMDTPTAGTIEVDQLRIDHLTGDKAANYRRHVGFVFQSFHLLSSLSALDNVLAPTMPFRNNRTDTEARAQALLERVGLQERMRALPSELSGGEQQRVAIARALIGNPGLLLADEPTGNLDRANTIAVMDLLLSLAAEGDATLLIATHDLQVASRCRRTVQLSDGRVTSS